MIVKKRFPLALVLFSSFIFLLSCKKVNEATLLGGGLVPEVDNINTFETTFAAESNNVRLDDTTKVIYTDPVAVGTITNDPEFGQTTASAYFQINPTVYGSYPFTAKDPLIDSVVLSLDYVGGYGDTNAQQTMHVYEVAQNTTFNDTTYYAFNTPEFETTSPELGSATFVMSSLDDSIGLIRNGDTTRVANQLRISLNPALGERLASYDTTTGSNGGYHDDTLFKRLFRGLALKADNGNGLSYFDLSTAKTNLTVYYRATLPSGTIDTAEVVFNHALRIITPTTQSKGGQANIITRQPGGGWANYIDNGAEPDDKLYIQSTPGGSAAYIKIPALDTFQNKLIHRAELIATRLPSTFDNLFPPPGQLFVDRINTKGDSAFLFPEFLVSNGTILTFGFSSFGGSLRADQTYRFNLTQLVQDILTKKQTNPTLRLYAPFDTRPFDPAVSPAQTVGVQSIPLAAFGRVVLTGGNYTDTGSRLRLRIIYSNL